MVTWHGEWAWGLGLSDYDYTFWVLFISRTDGNTHWLCERGDAHGKLPKDFKRKSSHPGTEKLVSQYSILEWWSAGIGGAGIEASQGRTSVPPWVWWCGNSLFVVDLIWWEFETYSLFCLHSDWWCTSKSKYFIEYENISNPENLNPCLNWDNYGTGLRCWWDICLVMNLAYHV